MTLGPLRKISLPLALALLAAGGLLLEIATTRVLSVLYFSTFTYLVLSIAVLGLAAGAALAALLPAARAPNRWASWAALASLAAIAVTLLAVFSAPWGLRLLLFPLTALPYLFLGLAIAGIFSERWGSSPALYLADLLGAGLGTLAAVPLIDLLGGQGGMLAAAALPAVAALLLAGALRPLPLAAAALCGAALFLQAAGGGAGGSAAGWGVSIDLRQMATPKPVRESLQAGGEVVATRWNAFARSDLVRMPGERYLIYLDGGAGSLVPDASQPQSWQGDIGSLAFDSPGGESPVGAFLIGPGGGLDVALARAAGTERIVAAEVNSGAIELTRGLEDHAGELYGEDTRVVIDDGRSALHRLGGEYDVILLSQVVSQAAEARGMALVENGLYTVEAFGEYLDHLSGDGRFALKLYDELTLTRAIVTALTTLTERGESAQVAARHLFAALDPRASPPVPLLMVTAEPLSDAEAIGWARQAEAGGFSLLFVPGLLGPPPLEAIVAGEAGVEALTGGSGDVDLSATRDVSPYFYEFEPGLPRTLRPLLMAVVLLLFLTLLLLLWRARSVVRGPEQTPLLFAPLIFAGLGGGFMLLEISALQRSGLAVGHPTLALAAVLAALLLGAALGSGLAGRTAFGQEFIWIIRSSLLASLVIAAWLLLWPVFTPALRALPPFGAALGITAILLPLAIPLGAPFPLMLRAAGRFGPAEVAAGWAMNGVASVTGAVAASAIAMTAGLHLATLAAALTYLGVAAVAALVRAGSDQGEVEASS